MAQYKVLSTILDLATGKMLAPGAILEINSKEKERIKAADKHVKNGILEKLKKEKAESTKTKPVKEK